MIVKFHERGYKNNYKELRNVVDFVLTKYIKKGTLDTLKIDISITNNIFSKETLGICNPRGCLPYRRFNITLKKDSSMLLLVLIHELIHVKQIVNKEWIPLDDDFKELWLNRDFTDVEYSEQPWEKEAYVLEDDLYEEWQCNPIR